MPKTTNQEIDVNLSEYILTPFSAATLINELLKNILYQKSQLPYPFDWIKSVIEKRRKKQAIEREQDDDEKFNPINITYENHYRKVSNAYDNLNSIMNGIIDQFHIKNNSEVLKIYFVFGTVINCPKEIFCICIPSVLKGHCEQNHLEKLNKNLHKVLRSLFLSQDWMDSIDATTPCTNVFIYLEKKQSMNQTNYQSSDIFEICDPLEIPSNVKLSTIKFINDQCHNNDCCRVNVFNENCDVIVKNEVTSDVNVEHDTKTVHSHVWNRSINLFTGFTDMFINKVSICQLW